MTVMLFKVLLIIGVAGFCQANYDNIGHGLYGQNGTQGVVPLGTLTEGAYDDEGICSKPATACQNCTFVVTCIPAPGGWIKVPLIGCRDGLTCDSTLGKCTNVPEPKCRT